LSDFVLDASLTLQWFRDEEADHNYSLAVLATLPEKVALVLLLRLYEVGNGLVVACRRKRINIDQIDGFLTRLRGLPIDPAQQTPSEILELPAFAQARGLTNYDAAYLALAVPSKLPLATTDGALRRTAASASVDLVAV